MIGFAPPWPRPERVRALVTTRAGGVSGAPFASLNLGSACGDAPAAVRENRARLRERLPGEPRWLRQVHGNRVVRAESIAPGAEPPQADALISDTPGVVCAVLAADCLPVLLTDRSGQTVAAVHAGWRGLSAGVIEAALAGFPVPASQILAYLGPAIGPAAYEVGEEVRAAFVAVHGADRAGFTAKGGGKYLCHLAWLARRRLLDAGVGGISGGDLCTHADPQRFYSFRRDGATGRFAALIWRVS